MTMAGEYDNMTSEDFDIYLAKALARAVGITEDSAESILLIPGVYEVLSEEFNNAALDLWLKDQE